MTNEEIKQEIAQRTGIPADLLTGETAEENIVRAKALLAFRRNNAQGTPKSTKEQFAAWFREVSGQDPQEDGSMQALKAYEEELRIANGGCPRLSDTGELQNMPDGRTPQEAFSEWFQGRTAFDPRKQDGWTPLA
jgi:hypothetical protein